MWQPGSAPDPTRPLRGEPVRRDEVLVGDWSILTMPLGTWTREERGESEFWKERWLVGAPALWGSLIDELAAEYAVAAARHAAAETRRREMWDEALNRGFSFGSWTSLPYPPAPQLPEFSEYRLREYICELCSVGYLYCHWRQARLHVCSDRCKRAWEKMRDRQWRVANPRASEFVNAVRTARRAAARASRVCAHCGVPIEAARSTKRFCSDICRTRHHYQRQRLKAAP